MQFGFRHGALQTEEEPVVEVAGVVDAVGIADQGVEESAEFQQAMPVGVVARQA